VPRSIRLSAASGLGRGGRPGSVDRRSCASGLESRVPWRGGASLADRSASSRLRVILSMRPGGPPPVVGRFPTPRGTRTRRAHESAWRVDVRESIWTPAIECQTSRCARSAAPCMDTPLGYSDSLGWAPCEAGWPGAILPEPPTPGRSRAPSEAPRRSRWSGQIRPRTAASVALASWLRRGLSTAYPRAAASAIHLRRRGNPPSELQGHDRAYGREARMASRSR
jgi:hypothetical protein